MNTTTYIGKKPLTGDHEPALPGVKERICGASFRGAIGDCTRTKGHPLEGPEGFHQGAHGYAWTEKPEAAEEEVTYERVDVEDALDGDQLLQAGEWVRVESVHFVPSARSVVFRFHGGGSLSTPLSHRPALRREVRKEPVPDPAVVTAYAEGRALGAQLRATSTEEEHARLVAGQEGVLRQYRTLTGPQGQPLRSPSEATRAREIARARGILAGLAGEEEGR